MKRALCLLLSAVLLLGLFAGCGKQTTPETTASTGTETTAAAETETTGEAPKKHVENLVIGTTTANTTFNLYSQTDIFGRINYVNFCRANWIYEDENGDLQPFFFTSFEISEDGKVLDFTWPTTAVWSDGEKVTWDDIDFTFRFLKDTAKSTSFIHLVSVEPTGDDSGRITFSEPDVYGWLSGSATMQGLLPKHVWEKFEGTDDY